MTNEPAESSRDGDDPPEDATPRDGAQEPSGASSNPSGYAPTGGYAAQHGLVRPVNDRYIAGVCGALGRATNTDPVLWRVLLPVLMVVGLLGGLIYLLGWLLIPSEGDSGSPFEALIGRGHSSMSRGWTLALTIFTVMVATSSFTIGRGGRLLLFAAIVAGAVFLLTSRDSRTAWSSRSTVQPPWAPPTEMPPPWTPAPAGDANTTTTAGAPAGVVAPAETVGDATPTPAWSAAPVTVEPPPGPPTYQPPFAPHGPYASGDPYQTSVFPTPGSGAPLPPAGVAAPRPPKPTGSRRAILSCVVLAVGVLGALDLSGAVSVPAPAYFAVALGVLGAGMIVASFFGRVRGPITLGILLVVGLMVSAAVSTLHGNYDNAYTIKPATVANLSDSYRENAGRMTVDLSDLDLSGAHTVSLHLNVGLLRVKVPRDVDVTVSSRVNVGAIDAFGHQRGGIGNSQIEVTDNGPDGPGGGTLVIDADVNVGKLEVSR